MERTRIQNMALAALFAALAVLVAALAVQLVWTLLRLRRGSLL